MPLPDLTEEVHAKLVRLLREAISLPSPTALGRACTLLGISLADCSVASRLCAVCASTSIRVSAGEPITNASALRAASIARSIDKDWRAL
jgi:hypothetical protein